MKRATPNRLRNNHRNRSARLETLESRKLMAANLTASGVWNISGTNAADEIYVARDNVDPTVLIAEVNGRIVGEEYADDVARIRVFGRGGDDWIEMDESQGAIRQRAFLYGQNGHDTLIGGSGRDVIVGGNGDDYLEGGPAWDVLRGGRGQNERVQGSAPSDNDIDDNDVPIKTLTNRVPAEWERHDSTWMQWPKGSESSYRDNFAGIIGTLNQYEQVNLAVQTNAAKAQANRFLESRGVDTSNVQFHVMPYDWSWMRDNGAIWVEQTDTSGNQSMAVQDWGFDGWGGDGGPSRKDDAVPVRVASIENVPVEKVDVVLEKGTLEFNGKDTLITSWTVLSNRNPGKSRGQLESVLKDRFGVSKVVWISGSAASDLTDGHVDGIARFVNENTVVVSRYADQSDPESKIFENAAKTIRNAGFKVVRMDIPGYVQYKGEWLPANYTNYLVANDVVIASSYGNDKFDNAAKARLQQLFPTRDIVMTDTRELWLNGGAVHCVTNDQPLLSRGTNRQAASQVDAVAPKLAPTKQKAEIKSNTIHDEVFANMDINQDGKITAADALAVINFMSRQSSNTAASPISAEFERFDTNDDGRISAIDALMLTNHLRK